MGRKTRRGFVAMALKARADERGWEDSAVQRMAVGLVGVVPGCGLDSALRRKRRLRGAQFRGELCAHSFP